jgi:hypothetical protein
MNRYPTPPPDWPQRRRTGLPFPPGRDGEAFEIYLDKLAMGPWDTLHINASTGEVYAQNGERWDAPGWLELPPRVRARIWKHSGHEPPPEPPKLHAL